MVILLFGPPGCGKGTQGAVITKTLGIPSISTGEIFRAELKAGTPLGNAAKQIMASGGLVGDDIVNAMVSGRLRQPDCRDGFLLDGYPRTLQQAEALGEFLSTQNIGLGYVVNVAVPDGVLEARVVGRRVCSNNDCGAIYHMETKPPKQDGICDLCGSPLKHRSDDTAEAFRSRMAEFNATFQPLLGFYERKPNFRSVDGNLAPEQVFESLVQLFVESA